MTARSDAGAAARRRAPAHARAAGARGVRRRAQHDVDAAVVAYPHGAAAPVVAELRERGVRVVDLSADFRLHDRARLRGLVRRARRARADRRPSTGCRSCTATRSRGADLVANPGCYPTAAILALAPLARAGLLGDVVIDAKSGVSGAGREPTHEQALRLRRRERHAVQGRPPPPHAGDRAGARRRRRARDVHAAPACRSPRASSSPATSRPTRDGRTSARALRRRLRARAVGRGASRARRACIEVRETNFCRISRARRRRAPAG